MFYLPDPAPRARGIEDDARSGSKSPPLVIILNISSKAAILIGSLGLGGKSDRVNTADSRRRDWKVHVHDRRREQPCSDGRAVTRLGVIMKSGGQTLSPMEDGKQSANVTIQVRK